jgi:type VI protein secretion system component Hcp
MDNAEVYLALVRPSFLPIGGEATMNGFEGQVELNSWTWAFHNQDEKILGKTVICNRTVVVILE